MAHTRPLRRLASVVLMLLGGLLMLLSTSVHTGLVVFALGVLLELIGIALERRGSRPGAPRTPPKDR